jgi:hypothetical protein
MDIEPDPSARPFWPQALASTFLVVGAVAFVAVFLFGGGQVTQCLGLGGCPGVRGYIPGPIPIIGTHMGALVVLWAVGVSWLIVSVLTVLYLWSTDRARLKRAIVGVAGLAGAASFVIALVQLSDGQGLRAIAEDTDLLRVVTAILAIPLVLAWAILIARRQRARP